GILLVIAGELLKMDPYEEVAQQGHAHPLSPAYVPDPMELDEHIEDQPYADEASSTAESPGYIADSDSMEEDTDEDSIDYPDEPEDGEEDDDEDPEDDPSEEHEPEDDDEDLEEDPNEEHEPEDEDTKDEEPFKGSDETEPFEEDETTITPPPLPRHRRARIFIRPQTPMADFTQALIDVFVAGSPPFLPPPTSPAYDQAPLGHRAAMIRMRDDILEEDMPPQRRFVLTAPPPRCDVAESFAIGARPPRGQYYFVDTVEVGQGLIRSPGHDARTIARAADKAEDVGYVRALQAFEHRMMTSIEEVNLRVSYQAQVRRRESEDFYTQLNDARTDRGDIRLEIDIVRGQRTAYETELHEVRQAYLSFEAQNRALLARLETLKTHMSRMEWQHQSAKDFAVRQMMRTQVLEARARIDTMEDAVVAVSCVVGLSQWLEKMELVFHISGCAIDNQVKFATCTLLGAALTWWNGHMRTLGHDAAYAMTWGTLKKKLTEKYSPKELALMCTKFLADETEKVDKYISGLPDNIHGKDMSARPKTLDDAIELANDLMDQKLRTYAERQNDNKRKADDSSRNNQQPHKKQNIARAYTTGPGKKKDYTRNLPLCTKCNYHCWELCIPDLVPLVILVSTDSCN
ncbi:hypothetical protein Tco_1137275, partial [Tanacetum coccineum]